MHPTRIKNVTDISQSQSYIMTDSQSVLVLVGVRHPSGPATNFSPSFFDPF
jgi:hypothetical protein